MMKHSILTDFMNLNDTVLDSNYKKNILERAKEQNAKYIMVVYDSFDGEDYAVICADDTKLKEKYKEYSESNMQRIMGIYDISE